MLPVLLRYILAIQAKFKAVTLTASLGEAIISAATKATKGLTKTDTSCLIWKVFGCYHRMMNKIFDCFLPQSLSPVFLYDLTCNSVALPRLVVQRVPGTLLHPEVLCSQLTHPSDLFIILHRIRPFTAHVCLGYRQ